MSDILMLTAALMFFLVIVGRKLGFLSPSSLFLFSQYAMAIGILPLLEEDNMPDRIHRSLLLLTFISYVVGALLVAGMLERGWTRGAYAPLVDFQLPAKAVSFWILLSIAIGVTYYLAIGYVAFFESLSVVVGGESEDVAGLRLESYAGSSYLYPGYVNQFKNALLPALFLVVVASSYRLEKPLRLLTAVSLGLIVLVLLIGTGQRHPFVKVLVLAVLIAYFALPKLSVRSILGVVAVGMPVFVVTTFASGRVTSDLESAGSFSDRAGVFVNQLFTRLFASDQLGGAVGFRYIYYRHNVDFGSEWMQELAGLLPGQGGIGIANEVFAVLYGSTRGTTPLSLWSSAYYNFGFWGTVVFAGLLGVIFALVSASFLKRRTLNLIQVAGVAGITMTLGLWISGGPATLLNSGFGVFVLLLVWGDRIEKRMNSSSRERDVSIRGVKATTYGLNRHPKVVGADWTIPSPALIPPIRSLPSEGGLKHHVPGIDAARRSRTRSSAMVLENQRSVSADTRS